MIKIILSTIITLAILTSTADTGYMNDLLPTHKIPSYREVVAEVTAYNATVEQCGKDDGITASGVKAVEGITIAADDLPFGQKVEIDGKTYVVQDRFGGNYRNRIDIFMDQTSRAWEFGRQRKIIKILEEANNVE